MSSSSIQQDRKNINMINTMYKFSNFSQSDTVITCITLTWRNRRNDRTVVDQIVQYLGQRHSDRLLTWLHPLSCLSCNTATYGQYGQYGSQHIVTVIIAQSRQFVAQQPNQLTATMSTVSQVNEFQKLNQTDCIQHCSRY